MSHPIIPIFGAGESGIGAALLAVRQGFEPWVTDAGEIREDRAKRSRKRAFNLNRAATIWPVRSNSQRMAGPSSKALESQKLRQS